MAIWVEAEPAVAAPRGQECDRQLGRNHSALWNDVWAPNDGDSDERFNPREFADIIYLARF